MMYFDDVVATLTRLCAWRSPGTPMSGGGSVAQSVQSCPTRLGPSQACARLFDTQCMPGHTGTVSLLVIINSLLSQICCLGECSRCDRLARIERTFGTRISPAPPVSESTTSKRQNSGRGNIPIFRRIRPSSVRFHVIDEIRDYTGLT